MNRLLFLILFFIPVLVYAQKKQNNSAAESLLRDLPKAKDDTSKVALLYNIAVNYLEANVDEANKYAATGLDLAQKLGWERGIVLSANLLGDNYADKQNYSKALEYYFIELKICEASGYKKRMAAILSKIGSIYWGQDNYLNALQYEIKVFNITQEIQDKKGMGRSLGNIGGIYLDIAKHPSRVKGVNDLISGDKKVNLNRSVDYSNKAIKLSEEVGDVEQLKTSYKDLSAAQKMQGNVKGALDSYGKFIALKHTILNPDKIRESERKQLEYEFAKREDSIRAQKLAAEQKLNEQTQIVTQQQQKLQATNMVLSATQKEKEKTSIALQQTQTDLTLEKTNAEEQERKLALVKDEQALQEIKLQLQQNELKLKDRELADRKREQYFYIIGIIGSLAFSVFAYRSVRLQKKYNKALRKEKKRSEALLLNILPIEVAEELMEKGFADAKHFDNVTVLFTDFVSFTTAAETMTPQQLVGELHICFKAFDEILSKYRIEKIKTIGDAYMAVSGLPVANPNHALHIIEAAMEIRDFMLKRKEQLGNNTFSVRIGINSGSVVAGIVGVTKYAYDIWGDAVNIAARMEQSSEDGKINISASTYHLVKDKYHCEYRGRVQAKNKGDIDMYYLLGKYKLIHAIPKLSAN